MLGVIAFLGAIALAVAICAYPLVRRLTRRLERLQAGVEQLGAGDLAARVKVEGKDEVARLAESFNRAADRIEELVGSHKLLLANASHELRTPLSRIRIGVELLKEAADPQAQGASWSATSPSSTPLIDEILLSSRLDAVKGLDQREEIDLLALAAEEGARYEHCTVAGEPVVVLRRPRAAAPHDAQPDRERRAARRPAGRGRGARREGAQRRQSPSATTAPASRASERERVFAPFFRLPGATAASGTGPRPHAGAADRAPARRRRALGRHARAAEHHPGDHSGRTAGPMIDARAASHEQRRRSRCFYTTLPWRLSFHLRCRRWGRLGHGPPFEG